MIRILPALLLTSVLALIAAPACAQSQGENGYGTVLLDGRNPHGEYLALTPRPGGEWLGFHYLADEQALFVGNCGVTCRPETQLTSAADRGRYVSAASRPALPGSRPIVAFYNATSGDLEAVDCFDGSCSFATLRVLDTTGDVGAGTATAVDTGTGLPYIAYYDASNGDLRLYRCATATCSSGSSVLVDGTGDRGRNPAIAIRDGVMTLVYDDSDSDELRVATAAAPYEIFTRTVVAPGSNAALTLTAAGLADIVFSGPMLSLERRRCTTSACTAFDTPGAVSAAIGSGVAPSVALLPSGNLFVTHRDEATGDLRGSVCNNADCDNPQSLLLEAGPGMGETSVALVSGDGRPQAVYRDSTAALLRSAQCTSAACASITRRVASNGLRASAADVALRADGRAVAIWTRLRAPRIGMCVDATCSGVEYRLPAAGNSDGSRPSIAVRPDGRPFAFYSYFGGNAAWDCADAECNTGTLREVAGTGNSTGSFTELAIRPDGRPVMLYARTSTNDVFLFSCADIDCTTGTEHLVVDEPTAPSTQLSGFSLVVGTDNRPRVAYNRNAQPAPGTFEGALRLARCDDVECTSSTVRSLNAEQSFNPVPMAVRSDQRPVLLEAGFGNRGVLTCDDVDCATTTRTPLPNIFDQIGPLALRAGTLPVFGSATLNTGGFWDCADAACGDVERIVTISDFTNSQRGFQARLAIDAAGTATLVFEEQELGDVWLSVALPEMIFASGFED